MSEQATPTAVPGATPNGIVTFNPSPAANTGPVPDAEKPLGEPGLKALQAERERGDRLENELRSLSPLKEQFEALRGVFGDKAEGQKPEDAMRNLQTQVEQLLQRDAVNALARTHGITDENDIARLSKIADPELRADMAERLKPNPAAPAAPQADPGQGARPGAASAEDAEYLKFYPTR